MAAADEQRIEPQFSDPASPGKASGRHNEPVPTPAEADERAPREALERELVQARAQASEQNEKFVRAAAELDNVRKRAEAEVLSAHKYGIERFAGELLGVRDSLEAAKAVDLTQDGVIQRVLEGLDLTLKLVDSAFAKFGITVVDPQGQKFDPTRHQAMGLLETDEVPPNHVAKVVQKGFTLHDRVLRPAMVMVGKAKAAT